MIQVLVMEILSYTTLACDSLVMCVYGEHRSLTVLVQAEDTAVLCASLNKTHCSSNAHYTVRHSGSPGADWTQNGSIALSQSHHPGSTGSAWSV